MPRNITRTAEPLPSTPETVELAGLDEFVPTPRHERVKQDTVNPSAGGGWSALKRHKQERTSYAQNFKIKEGEAHFIKFLDEEPFDSYYRHWLKGVQGRQTFSCLRMECPICDIGDSPTYIMLFNVVDLENRGDVLVWEASPQPSGVMEEFVNAGKWAPINRDDLYWQISKKKGGNGFINYSALPIKSRDLAEDEQIIPLDNREITALTGKKYDSEVIRVDTRQALREVVQSLEDE
jgi:hypothetical protein